MVRDLSQFAGCPPVTAATVRGRFAAIEAYVPAQHRDELWAGLGGMGTNQLLRYFAQDDFTDVDDFGAWLATAMTHGWVPHVIRDARTNAIVGMASYMRADPWNGVVEVGAVAHGPGMQRSPIATEAHYLLARHVFETLGYRRYEWKCHHENAPSKAAAVRYGFTYEGVFRQHMVAKHKNRDTVWYAMIDEEWRQLARAFERWLAPENFDASGVQRQRLEELRS